jgi:phospholipase/carboxylesterase
MAAVLLTSCSLSDLSPGKVQESQTPHIESAPTGRLRARPQDGAKPPAATGLQPLGLETGRDGVVYVPSGYEPSRGAQLVVMLHGAGGDARGGLDPLLRLADQSGLLLLSPASRDRTWDVLTGGFGADIAFMDRALDRIFSRYNIDRRHVAIGGFSDGASYALSVGLTNGDLFTHVIAFSPGFASPGEQQGHPDLFISHGIADEVLPISLTSRSIVPVLRRQGHRVRYVEFEGGHLVPPEISAEAVNWFLRDDG